MRKKRRKNINMKSAFMVGTLWAQNMHPMMDIDGPVEVASAKFDSQRGEQRKVGLIVNEMKRYYLKVAALQEA